jgi:hypothetical protein
MCVADQIFKTGFQSVKLICHRANLAPYSVTGDHHNVLEMMVFTCFERLAHRSVLRGPRHTLPKWQDYMQESPREMRLTFK